MRKIEKMGIIPDTIGGRIEYLRRNEGLTQEKLAEILMIKRELLNMYENGKRILNIDILLKLADIFRTTTDFILCLSPTPSTEPKIKEICDYTGLSENTIGLLNSEKHCQKRINDMAESNILFDISNSLDIAVKCSEINDVDDFRNNVLNADLKGFPIFNKGNIITYPKKHFVFSDLEKESFIEMVKSEITGRISCCAFLVSKSLTQYFENIVKIPSDEIIKKIADNLYNRYKNNEDTDIVLVKFDDDKE